MRLRDDVFLEPPAPTGPRRLTTAEKAALDGIGDRRYRAAQDFLWAEGASPVGPVVETANGRFSVGDPIEFVDPLGQRIAGRLDELSPGGALVSTAYGERALIPVERLERPYAVNRVEDKRAVIASAMAGGGGGQVTETRAPIPVNGTGDFALTIQGWSTRKPTEGDVLAYIAQRYPGARVLDADASRPGNKISVIVHFPDGHARAAQGMVPIHSPTQPIEERPEGAGLTQEFTDDKPHAPLASTAAFDAALESTEKALNALAAANPTLDFFETAIERSADGLVSHFAIHQAGAPAFLKKTAAGVELTQLLSEGAAPAIGYLVVKDAALGAALHGPDGEVALTAVRGLTARDDMFSPESLPHEDAPGAYEHGSYVTRADSVEGAPPARNPADYYTKGQWEREMSRYRDEEQRRILDEERKKQLRSQNPGGGPPWLETAPLVDQVQGEHIGGPGLQVAERTTAVDQATKEYWDGGHGYFDTPTTEGYGEALTRDVERKKAAKALIVAAWKEAGLRLTAAQLLGAMRLLTGAAKVAQQAGDLASSLLHSRTNDAAAAGAIDKMVADYLARNPEALDQLGVYDQALRGAIDYWERMQPKRLERIRQRFAPEQEEVGTATQPGVGQRVREWMNPSLRTQREVETMGGPSADDVARFNEQPYGGAPKAPLQPVPEDAPFALEFEPEPPPPPQAAPPAAAPAPGAKPAPKRRAPRERYEPEQGVQVFDEKGQPVAAMPGHVLSRFPSGAVRYRSDDGKVLMAFPPGVETPAGPAAPAPQAPAPQAPAPGGPMQRIKQRFLGAERVAYRPLGPQHTADDPTDGAYADETATDSYAGRRPPATAALNFKLTNVRRTGDYVAGDVVWDPELTAAMSAKNVEHNIVSFVKGRSTMKEPFDLGNIGRVRVRKLDVHTGMAEVIFRSSEARAFPPEQIVVDEGREHRDPLG